MVTRSLLTTLTLAFGITLIAISLISFPQESLEASKRGLSMWWEVVFPSLLPFFIISELLISYGVVKFIGILLEPLMRPLFRVPGVGGFVWAMGMASGFPAGAKLTARLRQENQINRIEAERLVSFTNASNPLFIFGAIAVGFFHNSNLGIILAVSHYLGNISVGILMRFYQSKNDIKTTETHKKLSLKLAIKTLHETRIKDKRAFGEILGDAVTSSIQTLLMIGGFIILFSVFNKLLYLVHFTDTVAALIQGLLVILHLPSDLAVPLIAGMFEITLGSQMTSQTENATLLHQVIITSFILGFSGFSVQAQVASILAETDISFKPFFIARIFQGIFAAIFAFLLWEPLYNNLQTTINKKELSVFQPETTFTWAHQYWDLLIHYGPLITLFSLTTYILLYGYKSMRLGANR